jgi:protein-S-isoprenylcysteine O-methyltransferase Ste14
MSIASPFIIFLAVLLYGLVHSIMASLRAKTLVRRWFGPAVDRIYRLAYNIFSALSLLPVLALPVYLPDRMLYVIPFPWLLLTAGLQGLAIVALLVGMWQTGLWSFIGLRQIFEPQPVDVQRLIIRGLYRWVRHPLYTAGLFIIWLIPVMTVNLLALNLGLSLYLVIGAIVEERKLLSEFGQAYTNYQDRTPMLIPMPPGKTGRRA